MNKITQKVICPQCGKHTFRITKGVCHNCYRRTQFKVVECKRCGELKQHQAFGLCRGCYNSIFQIEKAKKYNQQKIHDLSPTMYNNLTQKCEICGFDIKVELHHIDGNHKNFSVKNLVGLCPNCHAMAGDRWHKFSILKILGEKGYTIPDTPKTRFDRMFIEDFHEDLEKIRNYLFKLETDVEK